MIFQGFRIEKCRSSDQSKDFLGFFVDWNPKTPSFWAIEGFFKVSRGFEIQKLTFYIYGRIVLGFYRNSKVLDCKHSETRTKIQWEIDTSRFWGLKLLEKSKKNSGININIVVSDFKYSKNAIKVRWKIKRSGFGFHVL